MGMDGIYIWSVSGDPVLGFEPNSISHELNPQKIHFFTEFTKTIHLHRYYYIKPYHRLQGATVHTLSGVLANHHHYYYRRRHHHHRHQHHLCHHLSHLVRGAGQWGFSATPVK